MKKYYASITPKSGRGMSIDKLIESLEDYKRIFTNNIQIFIDRLMDVGISVAEANTGEYGSYIVFEKHISKTESGYLGVLVAKDSKKIMRYWKSGGGVTGYEISPLLMAEFGSGWLAHVMQSHDYRSNTLGVGQGTMPNQTHAFDPQGWFWKDKEGKTHHSYGEAPTYPIYSAVTGMLFEVDRIAREVFDG